MTEAEGRTRRIVIGASCYSDALSALRLLDATGGMAASDIRGLLVASNILEDVAGPPRRSVVTPSGALVAAPSSKGARALIEGDAKAFQRRLASMAQSCAASWSFEVRGGDLIERIWEAEFRRDLLIVGYQPEHKRQGSVVLLSEVSSRSDEAQTLAEVLGQRLHSEVISLSFGLERPPEDVGEGAALALRALLSRLNRINAEAVILDFASASFRSRSLLRAIYSAARCPLLILGTADEPKSA